MTSALYINKVISSEKWRFYVKLFLNYYNWATEYTSILLCNIIVVTFLNLSVTQKYLIATFLYFRLPI